ncbi:MAG: type III-B CRISPR-associated protein Cas10/Cmr2, partial [Leptolyngbya sp. SIO3F4]|nr:type III-B CRISPR-associated protein Cas10/Cmr2 [Leptolyngbya sp. SIO3F4]
MINGVKSCHTPSQEKNMIEVGLAWCLAWGDGKQPQVDIKVLQQMRQAMLGGEQVPEKVRLYVEQVRQLARISIPETLDELKKLAQEQPGLWNSKIGLVYGGATKIKQYVFEAAKLHDIRGTSALLDRINLFDLPAFFNPTQSENRSVSVEQWLDRPENFPGLRDALIPELIIYSTGGNILTFCPIEYADDLANAIEKRYTYETLTANSCAVGKTFRLLELKLGLLKDSIEETFWLEQYLKNQNSPIVQSYFCQGGVVSPEEKFWNRKNFTELITQLTTQYNQRRSGFNSTEHNRPTRCYPPMFETHPYMRRDENDRQSAIAQVPELGDRPWLSESLARKRITGQIAKRESYQNNLPSWFTSLQLEWQPIPCRITSWVADFEDFLALEENLGLRNRYYKTHTGISETKTLRELGNISKPQGFIAYIYADGNNMGGYIQREVHQPQEHKRFSSDVFNAVKESVYQALSQHLNPRQINGLSDPDNIDRNGEWIHPFEIITIGGDDVLLIVPADKALSISQTIGEAFENYLADLQSDAGEYIYRSDKTYDPSTVHRYKAPQNSKISIPTGRDQCKLSMSIGTLITAENTPIYYAENLVSQLLKSAKQRAKDLRKDGYLGGTIDFLTLKAVTMLSDKIENFREEGLTKKITIQNRTQTLKQYATPYTLHEVGGLIDTVKALKPNQANFPKSQLYQIRSLLERGKQTAILNYRYFSVRLKPENNQQILKQKFETPWCSAKTNGGNLAPWMSYELERGTVGGKVGYETIWRDLVELYEFIDESEETDSSA